MINIENISRLWWRWIDVDTQRWAKIHLLTLMFNVCNTGLYIESLNEFPEHFKWNDQQLLDHPLSEYSRDSVGEILAFVVIFVTAFVILFPRNQKSYYQHIEEIPPEKLPILNRFFPQRSDPFERGLLLWGRPTRPTKIATLALMAAGFKAVAASSSFAALPFLRVMIGEIPTIVMAAFLCIGNFVSQLAILANPKRDNIHLGSSSIHFNCLTSYPKLLSCLIHFLTACYNATNTALYFNAGDAFFRNINYRDHRLSSLESWWECSLLVVLIIGSISLAISTQRSYSRRVTRFFTKTEPYWHDSPTLNWVFSCESITSTIYKALINSISLVAAVCAVGARHLGGSACLWSGSVAAVIFFVGNWAAQYSVLKPEPSKTQYEESLVEPKISQSWCCGLFGKTVVAEPVGLSNPNVSSFV